LLATEAADRGPASLTLSQIEEGLVMRAIVRQQNKMKVISVNVGLPREVVWNGMTVHTGIFKQPVNGPVAINELNLAGDRQADLSVHGGVNKAVYAYPAEHYDYWRKELPDVRVSWGHFGENLTTEGLLEEILHIGDRVRVEPLSWWSPSPACLVTNWQPDLVGTI
jgi:hypothetical protein